MTCQMCGTGGAYRVKNAVGVTYTVCKRCDWLYFDYDWGET
ncbi:hypothetical protein [Nocardiopsis sp. FR4]|nr:hypothetical protein [Nocardiopsis sp. FR4]